MSYNYTTREIAYKVLRMVQELAPTGTIQQHFANLYNDAIIAGEPDAEVVKILIHALSDGLDFGNWP